MITTERETTAYARWSMYLQYGSDADITIKRVAAMPDPDQRPGDTDWEDAIIIQPNDANLGRGELDLAILLGPESGERIADVTHSGIGEYQLWVAFGTNDEYVVERMETWEVT